MTIVGMWVLMAIITFGAWIATRKVETDFKMSRWQNFCEVLIIALRNQIKDMHPERPERVLSIHHRLKEGGVLAELDTLQPEPVATKWLEEVHAASYVEQVKDACAAGRPMLDADTLNQRRLTNDNTPELTFNMPTIDGQPT